MTGQKHVITNITAALLTGAAVFLADILTKIAYFDQVNEEGGAFSFLGGLIRSTLHHNYGISFDIALPLWLIVLITGLALGWALAILIERAKTGRLAVCLVLGLFLGGVLGNVFDRLTLGFVRDWLLFFGRSAINFADVAVGGSILLFIFSDRLLPLPPPHSEEGESKGKKAPVGRSY